MLKRLLDLSVSALALAVFAIPMLLIAVAILSNMGRPVFFRQRRPGLNGKSFIVIKFRTMRNHKDDSGQDLPDHKRMTKLGGLLRRTSLDELPTLWNVLKGDMSLVGPRPLLEEYLPLYTAEQARRHQVKPGLTGWAQINGRNLLSWPERFALDVWYVDNQSWWLDLKILWITLIKVLRAEGISHPGHATMEKFSNSRR